MTPAKLANERSAHIGFVVRWMPGSGRSDGSYHPTPKPSAFTVPLTCRSGAQAWRASPCGGSTRSACNVIGGPR